MGAPRLARSVQRVCRRWCVSALRAGRAEIAQSCENWRRCMHGAMRLCQPILPTRIRMLRPMPSTRRCRQGYRLGGQQGSANSAQGEQPAQGSGIASNRVILYVEPI
eukprot:scaffold130549_cov31-Tisochrysis_lutea.AAC.6